LQLDREETICSESKQQKEEDTITQKEKENDEFTSTFRDVYYWFHYLRTLFVGITNYDLQKS
jgi:hypothetical protein